MIWIELVCDGCNDNPWGEYYRKGSVARIKANAKANGWKTINGKIYCPECQARMRAKKTDMKNER